MRKQSDDLAKEIELESDTAQTVENKGRRERMSKKYLVAYNYAPKKLYNKWLKEAKSRYGEEKIMRNFGKMLESGALGLNSVKLKDLESFYPKHIEEEIYKKSRLKIMGVRIIRVYKIHGKNLEAIPLWTLEEFINKKNTTRTTSEPVESSD